MNQQIIFIGSKTADGVGQSQMPATSYGGKTLSLVRGSRNKTLPFPGSGHTKQTTFLLSIRFPPSLVRGSRNKTLPFLGSGHTRQTTFLLSIRFPFHWFVAHETRLSLLLVSGTRNKKRFYSPSHSPLLPPWGIFEQFIYCMCPLGAATSHGHKTMEYYYSTVVNFVNCL
jgi:hypothetical protein